MTIGLRAASHPSLLCVYLLSATQCSLMGCTHSHTPVQLGEGRRKEGILSFPLASQTINKQRVLQQFSQTLSALGYVKQMFVWSRLDRSKPPPPPSPAAGLLPRCSLLAAVRRFLMVCLRHSEGSKWAVKDGKKTLCEKREELFPQARPLRVNEEIPCDRSRSQTA